MIAKFNKKLLTTYSTKILLKNFTIATKPIFSSVANVEQFHNRDKKQKSFVAIVEKRNKILWKNLTIATKKIPYTQVYRYVCRLIACRPHILHRLVTGAQWVASRETIFAKIERTKIMPKKINNGDCFFLPIIPPTKTNQEKGINFKTRRVYTTSELRDVEAKFDAYLFPHRPAKPLNGPVRLYIRWMFPVVGDHTDGEWKTTKPDVDNSVKTLIDRMTRLGFWKDDAQIASLLDDKVFAEIPGIYIAYSALMEA